MPSSNPPFPGLPYVTALWTSPCRALWPPPPPVPFSGHGAPLPPPLGTVPLIPPLPLPPLRARCPPPPPCPSLQGTVAPITVVSEVMFPYARKHAVSHLEAAYDTQEAQEDIELIRGQVGGQGQGQGGGAGGTGGHRARQGAEQGQGWGRGVGCGEG